MGKVLITQMPFLYPFLFNSSATLRLATSRACRKLPQYRSCYRLNSTVHSPTDSPKSPIYHDQAPDSSRLNPAPSDYSRSIFQDRCSLTVHTGSGGNGCVSFLREKYIEEGPANGGDGGTGGSVYIQAIEGQTSLHKLARRGVVKAGRGKNGQGKSKGGVRGEDVLLQVPVGTVVREIWRYDPLHEEEERLRLLEGSGEVEEGPGRPARPNQWVLYPGAKASDFLRTEFPSLPGPRRSPLANMQPKAPINLDLSEHMERPMLLAAGAVGGLGNPNFVTRSAGRPKFATKGEQGMKIILELELKILADVGLVGLPNAGKSTLLRALTNSRTRIGNWAFTTLSPNIGTVVLDNHKGRPAVISGTDTKRRDNFTIADIPGLIEGAHLDKGLGLGFLRHIERAKVLTFVIDLTAGDAVQALKGLWHEIGQYERLRSSVLNSSTEQRLVEWSPFDDDAPKPKVDESDGTESTIVVSSSPSTSAFTRTPGRSLPPLALPPIYSKPWFVVATKADLPETRENYASLRAYLDDVEKGAVEHPGQKNGWKERICAVPVSAIKGEGVDKIPEWISGLLDRL